MNILVAEDNPMIAYMIEQALLDAGHAVLGPAATQEEACSHLDCIRPDLALLDIDLADGRTGPLLARLLVERYGCPVLFLTGQTGIAQDHAQWSRGILPKPFSPAQIVQLIEHHRTACSSSSD